MAERISNQVLEQPERVVARDNITIDGCQIQGTLELQSNQVIVTNCMFYSSDEPGIRMVATNQNGIQLTGNDWPQEAITEISEGRITLQNRGFVGTEPVLSGHPSIIRCLDEQIPNTDVTYRLFLLRNNLVSSIYESLEMDGITLVVPWEGYETTGNFGTLPKRKPKFSSEVTEKAWKLLEEYMNSTQYFAFKEGNKIELQNKAEDFRLLIDKKGDFVILEGKTGEGVVATSGRIKSYDYPLGDEIAAFLDWFKFKTKELISQWNCGTYGIVKEGERR